MDLTNLAAEFPRDAIHWRPQGKPLSKDGRAPVCMALAYIDPRDVMDRLDDVSGPDRWQTEFIETPKGRVICRIGILTDNGWVWKGDGAGDTDVEGEKGGISDALKRAAVSWGIGRYLYRLDSVWAECEVGSNGQWRKWAQDPWSKVRAQKAPAKMDAGIGKQQTPMTPQAAQFRLMACQTLDELQAAFRDLNANHRETARHPEVIAAKDVRKSQLTEQKAA